MGFALRSGFHARPIGANSPSSDDTSQTRRPGWYASKPGPKGQSTELIEAILEMKRRNSRYGCPRIAQQIAQAFGIEIDKDVVRRILAKYYRPDHGGGGPSWLTAHKTSGGLDSGQSTHAQVWSKRSSLRDHGTTRRVESSPRSGGQDRGYACSSLKFAFAPQCYR